MDKLTKIYIAGHRGMVGSAVWRALENKGYTNLVGRSSKELDLKDQQAVLNFLQTEKPEAIIDAAARVGGILANIYVDAEQKKQKGRSRRDETEEEDKEGGMHSTHIVL